MPQNRGIGMPALSGNFCNLKIPLMLLLTVLLFSFVIWQEGVTTMMSAVAIELGIHFAITIGCRVQGRT